MRGPWDYDAMFCSGKSKIRGSERLIYVYGDQRIVKLIARTTRDW